MGPLHRNRSGTCILTFLMPEGVHRETLHLTTLHTKPLPRDPDDDSLNEPQSQNLLYQVEDFQARLQATKPKTSSDQQLFPALISCGVCLRMWWSVNRSHHLGMTKVERFACWAPYLDPYPSVRSECGPLVLTSHKEIYTYAYTYIYI